MSTLSRRQFIKNAIVTGAAITAFPTIFVRKAPTAWARKTIVHPEVDNLRVVGITDPAMTKAAETIPYGWAGQDNVVVTEAVWANIDKLACALAATRNPKEAWQAIFIKPPRKSWSDTVVAIKTNNFFDQHTHSAIMAKICHVMTDTLGVKASNIHIYDAWAGVGMRTSTPFAGLPAGCRIENEWGGCTQMTKVPAPWNRSAPCLKHLVDGSVDILINIAMCKGHWVEFGGFTMTMKNHFGTFSPMPAHEEAGGSRSLDYLLAINQSPEILGPMDKQTGKILYPRQQLCLIDALWASQRGPEGRPSHQPNYLAMGVLSPVVDYQVATKFRGKKMGWEPNTETTHRILTVFGYTEGDLPNKGEIIEV